MPWTAKDATRHTKQASTPARARLWRKVGNERLAAGASEGSAIRQANAVVRRAGARTNKRSR